MNSEERSQSEVERARYLQSVSAMTPEEIQRRITHIDGRFFDRWTVRVMRAANGPGGDDFNSARRSVFQSVYLMEKQSFKKDCRIWRHKGSNGGHAIPMTYSEMEAFEEEARKAKEMEMADEINFRAELPVMEVGSMISISSPLEECHHLLRQCQSVVTALQDTPAPGTCQDDCKLVIQEGNDECEINSNRKEVDDCTQMA